MNPGENFLRYKIVSPLGSGGMGEVYLAKDRQLERKVAIKILRPKYSHHNADGLRRFVLEARSASALNHPNIITIYDIGESEGSHYIASEFIDGETLHQRIHDGTLELAEIFSIAIQIAEALTAAHAAGIVHRDIKPENVMIRGDGYVKVLDFGLAKLTEHEMVSAADIDADTKKLIQTNPGMVLGTVSYMSPEQARARPVDTRTDIWSLGVVLYEMVTGCRPFAGETTSDVIAAILRAEPTEISIYTPDAPRQLAHIIRKALRKDRDERYQHIKDLLIDLKDLRRELDIQMRSDTASFRTTDGRQPGANTDGTASSPRSTAKVPAATGSISEMFLNQFRLHPVLITAVIAVLVFGLAAGGIGLRRMIWRTDATQSFRSMRFTRLTNTGLAEGGLAALSPDGKYVAYAMRDEGRYSLWVRQSTTSGNVQVVPTGEFSYTGLTFSNDGRFIYFTASDANGASGVFRIATLGGDWRKLASNAFGAVSVSPDDAQIVFIRGNREMLVCNTDGTQPRAVASAGAGEAWWLPAWSPDGKTIATTSYKPETSSVGLTLVDVDNGSVQTLGPHSWQRISGLVWKPDGNGLLLTGRDPEIQFSQIWSIAYPAGELTRITNDLNNYIGISLAADGKTAVSIQEIRVSNLWISDGEDLVDSTKLTSELGRDEGLSGLAALPNGSVVYTTRIKATPEIWIVDQGGKSNRPLPLNPGSNFHPAVTPDGRSIVFASDRGGNVDLWKMDVDGQSPVQLTDTEGVEGQPDISPDGRWIVYQVGDANRQIAIWKMPADGGAPVRMTEGPASMPRISPDGKNVACVLPDQTDGGRRKILILSLEGDAAPRVLDLPDAAASPQFRWSADGQNLIYIDGKNRGYGLWTQPIQGGQRSRIAGSETMRIFNFDVLPEGQGLVLARGSETSDVVMIDNF